jgi:hypothetical protein
MDPTHNLISLAVSTSGVTMLRLDRMSMKDTVGSSLVKISANCALVGTFRTRTSPNATFSQAK